MDLRAPYADVPSDQQPPAYHASPFAAAAAAAPVPIDASLLPPLPFPEQQQHQQQPPHLSTQEQERLLLQLQIQELLLRRQQQQLMLLQHQQQQQQQQQMLRQGGVDGVGVGGGGGGAAALPPLHPPLQQQQQPQYLPLAPNNNVPLPALDPLAPYLLTPVPLAPACGGAAEEAAVATATAAAAAAATEEEAAAAAGGREGRRGLGTRGDPVDQRAIARYNRLQRHRQRRRGLTQTVGQAAEALEREVRALEEAAGELRAREGAMRTTLGAQEALIATMRALVIGGAGKGRRGEVLDRTGSSAGNQAPSSGRAASGAGGGGGGGGSSGAPQPSAAEASKTSAAAATDGGAVAAAACPGLRAQVVQDVQAFAKAAASGLAPTAAGSGGGGDSSARFGPEQQPQQQPQKTSSDDPSGSAPVASTSPAAVPSRNSSARGLALQYGRHTRRYARVVLALDALLSEGDDRLAERLMGHPSALGVAAALRPRLSSMDEEERAHLRRVAAWRPPACLLAFADAQRLRRLRRRQGGDDDDAATAAANEDDGGSGVGGADGPSGDPSGSDDSDSGDSDTATTDPDDIDEARDDGSAAGGLVGPNGSAAHAPERLLMALAPVVLAGEDPPDGPLGLRIGFAKTWALAPREAAWLYALCLETGEARPGGVQDWLRAARVTRRSVTPAALRLLMAAHALYRGALGGVMAERRRLQQQAAQAAGAADAGAALLVEAVDRTLRREDALTFVYEWTTFLAADPVSRARVMPACFPLWVSSPDLIGCVVRLVAAEEEAGRPAPRSPFVGLDPSALSSLPPPQ